MLVQKKSGNILNASCNCEGEANEKWRNLRIDKNVTRLVVKHQQIHDTQENPGGYRIYNLYATAKKGPAVFKRNRNNNEDDTWSDRPKIFYY